MDTKCCYKCKTLKPLEEFANKGGGRKSHLCKKCFNRGRSEAKKERLKARHVKAFSAIAEQTGSGCAICGQPAAVLDHDHTTGKIRGLLCKGCNLAIGNLGDSPVLLRRALAYLEANHDYGTYADAMGEGIAKRAVKRSRTDARHAASLLTT